MDALVNGCVLTEHGFQEQTTVVIQDGRICSVISDADLDHNVVERRNLDGQLLLPGFIDVQVNGGNGVLFNDAPSVDAIRDIGAAHRAFGTTGFLPTLISDELAVMEKAIVATEKALKAGIPGLMGIHL